MTEIKLYGIRHHGPGSARSLLKALDVYCPEIILIEGPHDALGVLDLLYDKAMKPPIALLLYAKDNPAQAAYYPFAVFSPEYQALHFAKRKKIPFSFMDLPQRYMLPLRSADLEIKPKSHDPLLEIAKVAGYSDAERWWDALIEQQNSEEIFELILEMMQALREDPSPAEHFEALREAYMRQMLRHTIESGYQRIAVVCGAWHTPALVNLQDADEDKRLLSNLEEVETEATWIPWTYSRLAKASGYGAGIVSPSWYQYLWENQNQQNISIGWLSKVAQYLRDHDLSASPAQVIDAVRLAESLATLRNRAVPDLQDLNEACLSVICHGNPAPMKVVVKNLIIGEAMGHVPKTIPKIPIQADFEAQLLYFGLEKQTEKFELELDLRNEFERQLSQFLHRLGILEISWASKEDADEIFESWVFEWQPAIVLQLIEKSIWGTNILEAATGYSLDKAQKAEELSVLTKLLHDALLADLPNIASLVQALEALAATTGDIVLMMDALPPLVNILLYGDTRRSEMPKIKSIVETLSMRITLGLPNEALGLDDANADKLLDAVILADWSLQLWDEAAYLHDWRTMLKNLMDAQGIHGLIRGRCARLVIDANFISQFEGVRQMRLALATVARPEDAAAWLRGFLKDSGLILVYDDYLLSVLDDWLISIRKEAFEAILPLLRRTFASFEYGELRNIARRISGKALRETLEALIEAASEVDETIDQLLGKGGKA